MIVIRDLACVQAFISESLAENIVSQESNTVTSRAHGFPSTTQRFSVGMLGNGIDGISESNAGVVEAEPENKSTLTGQCRSGIERNQKKHRKTCEVHPGDVASSQEGHGAWNSVRGCSQLVIIWPANPRPHELGTSKSLEGQRRDYSAVHIPLLFVLESV